MPSTLKKLAFTGVVLAFFGLLMELGLRLVGFGQFVLFEPHPELIWQPTPDQQGRTVAGLHPITIDDRGLRPSAHPMAEKRVVTFGDSVTMGWGVGDAETYSARLEAGLREQTGEEWAVDSAGVNAYPLTLCARRAALLAESESEVNSSALWVLAYSFNNRMERLVNGTEAERDGLRKNVRRKNLLRRFALYNFVIETVLREAVYYRSKDRMVGGDWGTRGEFHDTNLAHQRQAMEDFLSAAGERPVVFLLLSSTGQTELSPYQEQFQSYAVDHGVPVVDIVSLWAGTEGRFMDNVHPTAEGHQLLADALLPAVLEALEPPSPAVEPPSDQDGTDTPR